jgi:hypothetical protein
VYDGPDAGLECLGTPAGIQLVFDSPHHDVATIQVVNSHGKVVYTNQATLPGECETADLCYRDCAHFGFNWGNPEGGPPDGGAAGSGTDASGSGAAGGSDAGLPDASAGGTDAGP